MAAILFTILSCFLAAAAAADPPFFFPPSSFLPSRNGRCFRLKMAFRVKWEPISRDLLDICFFLIRAAVGGVGGGPNCPFVFARKSSLFLAQGLEQSDLGKSRGERLEKKSVHLQREAIHFPPWLPSPAALCDLLAFRYPAFALWKKGRPSDSKKGRELKQVQMPMHYSECRNLVHWIAIFSILSSPLHFLAMT